MDAILAFDIKKCITINGILPCYMKENINFFYNKTKCNVVIMVKNNDFTNRDVKRQIKNRINIVLTRKPYKYKEFIEEYKNIFFENSQNDFYENIILIPRKYSDMYTVLNKFIKIIETNQSEVYKNYNPICKILWVAKSKENSGCELFFDYELENNFCEEKVFDNDICIVYKYTKL